MACFAFTSVASAQVTVATVQNDIGRTGQNLNETILTPSNVNSVQFGKLFAQATDGYVYAQPLYMPALSIAGTTHNVVFIATQHDSVYAFDADSNSGANAAPLWQASLLSTSHGAATGATTVPWPAGSDIVPEVGITGTPVIDPTTNTLYVVSATVEGSVQVQRLHALDVTTGNEKFGGPVVISPSVPGSASDAVDGTLKFNPIQELQRPGLLLLNGIVYVGFSSHEDHTPWHGWIVGFNAATLEQTGVFNASPNGWGGGIWMSGAGLAADQLNPTSAPYGRMFVATGNGDYTASPPYGTSMDYGDSHVDLNLANGAPTVTDEFTTNGQANDAATDGDVGAGGVLILPTQTSGTYPHLLVQSGKAGTIYLLNRDNLGGYNATQDKAVQELSAAVGDLGTWSSPAYWNGHVYYWGQYDTLKAFSLTNGLLSTTPTAVSSETYGFPGATPAISANGTTQGIVWSINSEAYNAGPEVLQAHSASNVATTLYSSSTNGARDQAGPAVKFAIPTVANGKVYVGAGGALDVYGLLGTAVTQAGTPTFSPVAGAYAGAQSVTISDVTAGATIYYTTNGSTPTTSSTVYSAPIGVSTSETLQAIAVKNGYTTSAVGSAAYTISSPDAPTPTFSPLAGNYASAQTVTISDAASGAKIYYTTNNSTPSTNSPLYSGPITVSASETLEAIAVANGYSTSETGSASYTIGGASVPVINDPTGFSSSNGLSLVGTSQVTGGALQLTSASGGAQTNAAWYSTPVNVQSFTTDFYFQETSANADGFTFTLQNVGLSATSTGGGGGGLGFQGIGSSVAVKFDLYNNNGEGIDSTGFYTDGASPTVPAVDMTSSGVNLHLTNILHAHLVYNGTTLTLTLTDTVTGDTFTTSTAINIPATVGANTAYAGFTGATGGQTATQSILSWTYTVTSGSGTPVAATPTFSPVAGSYSGTQSVTISDATTGTTIYYTTNGSTPTTSSAVYSAPIGVSTSETLQAIAVESGYTTSAVGSAAYTISLPAAATPTFSPPGGSYSGTESVTISDATTGTTIYYTTNGSTPTTSSAVYSAPISVSTSETLKAIAAKTGYSTSAVGSAAYTISSSTVPVINDPTGFSSSNGLSLVGTSQVTGGALQLTSASGGAQTNAAWYSTPVNVQSFTTDFYFQETSANADGFTFTLQNVGLSATSTGGGGGGLGFQGIGSSVAVKFDLYNNNGEGIDSTGFYTDGASPTVPAVDMTSSGVNLHLTNILHAHLVYNGTTLTLTLTDTVTGDTFTTSTAINIPATVGANTAYAGFTGATGGQTATQSILSWTYTVTSGSGTPVAATPTFSPVAGSYSGTQSVTISDATTGTTIYYTTNGSTPTTSSAVYSAPIGVSTSETLQAIAVESGYTTSAVGSAAYTISLPAAATPTFSPPGGSYSGTESVTISDATTGTTIYYTTNGSTPTTSSAVYSAPISVSTSETLKAIAAKTGYSTSAVGSAAYTISSSTVPVINDPTGFSSSNGLSLVGTSQVTGGALQLTSASGGAQTNAAWYSTPVNVQSFTTDFYFQETSANADGFTFTLQNVGLSATSTGGGGGGLGFQGIGSSVAVKFDLYNNNGEGIDSTGFYTDGASPTVPAVDMTSSGVNLHLTNILHAHLVYNGTTLTLTLTDTVTGDTFTTSTAINIPATVGANTAYVGFTGATGGQTATQSILSWTYTVN